MNAKSAGEDMGTPSVTLQPVRLVGILGVIAGVLVTISLAGQLIRYVGGHDHVYGLLLTSEKLFNVDNERNITTLFSVFLLLCAAFLLGLISILKRQPQDPDCSKWMILTCGFIYLATDEGWSFHEMLIEPIRKLLGHDNLGVFFFAWVIPAMAGVVILALFFLRFLLRLSPSARWSFLGAGAIFLGGAIGAEMLGGRYAESHGSHNLTYQLITHLEESMEMAGIIVFIYALLRYLAEQYPIVQCQIGDQHPGILTRNASYSPIFGNNSRLDSCQSKGQACANRPGDGEARELHDIGM
ncbi:MAG: multidrug transporter [Nitrospira sp. CG24A]|nr:MAG: multidrug transporter [Nitrospira sp. CG24A]